MFVAFGRLVRSIQAFDTRFGVERSSGAAKRRRELQHGLITVRAEALHHSSCTAVDVRGEEGDCGNWTIGRPAKLRKMFFHFSNMIDDLACC